MTCILMVPTCLCMNTFLALYYNFSMHAYGAYLHLTLFVTLQVCHVSM